MHAEHGARIRLSSKLDFGKAFDSLHIDQMPFAVYNVLPERSSHCDCHLQNADVSLLKFDNLSLLSQMSLQKPQKGTPLWPDPFLFAASAESVLLL